MASSIGHRRSWVSARLLAANALGGALRAVARLAKSWWSIDRVRAARREGRILRLRPPAVIVLDGREIEILRRDVTHGARGVVLSYECRSLAGPAEIRVAIDGLVVSPRIAWIENGREEFRSEDEFEIW